MDAEEAVRAHMRGVLARVVGALVESLSLGAGEGAVASAVERAEAAVSSDEGAVALMAAAYQQGREDAGAQPLREGGAPDWGDVESPGERGATWRETHLCLRCAKGRVCAVARAAPAECLVVVARCLDFA